MDIVERLRFFAPKSVSDLYSEPEQVMSDAADEIERLQKRVELLEGYLNGALDFVEGFAHCYTEEARKALKGKE